MKHLPILFFLLFSTSIFGQLSVTNTVPEAQSLTSETSDPIIITFSEEISPFSFGNLNFQVFGRWSGPMEFEDIDFDFENHIVTFNPSGSFISGEMVTVMLSRNVGTPNNEFLEKGYAFSYWIKTETGSLNLELIQEIEMREDGESLIQCYGAYAGDLNDDGFSDLSVINENSNDVRVLINDGLGTYGDFTTFGLPSGNKPSPSEGADFNHDGNIDLAVSHVQSDDVSILMGNGDGSFQADVGYTTEQGVRGLAIIDLEADGHTDIVTANRNASSISFLHNDGTGIFETATIAGISNGESGIAVADANEDGIMDLFVGAHTGGEVYIMLNDGDGNFFDSGIADVVGQSWMITVGDVNNDGHVDLVSANSTGNNCSVHFGNGMGGFLETTTYTTGFFPLAIDLGDLDGDGDLDMITSNYSGDNYTLFENLGAGVFADPIIYPASAAGSCAIFHDRDNDGILDMTLVDEVDDIVFLYKNHSTVAIEEIENNTILASPNPFSEGVNFSIQGNIKDELVIYDILGKIVVKLKPSQGTSTTNYYWKSDENIELGTYSYKIKGLPNGSGKLLKVK